jgi:alanine dehydrogenase
MFIAAVGADSPAKQELGPLILAEAKLVTDLTSQAAEVGELHHAIHGGWIGKEHVHA